MHKINSDIFVIIGFFNVGAVTVPVLPGFCWKYLERDCIALINLAQDSYSPYPHILHILAVILCRKIQFGCRECNII